MVSSIQASALFAALLVSGALAEPGMFLRKVSMREITSDVEASLADLLGGHASEAASKRLAKIEASIWQTFQALPKNSMGRLTPQAVRHIVHSYFARAHGWQLKGLEPVGMHLNGNKVHEVDILQDKAPLLVEGLLAARHQDNGLDLTDVTAMVAVLEQLVFDESVTLLESAYNLNAESLTSHIDEAALHKVLQSYLVLFGQGAKADLFDVARHLAIRERRLRNGDIEDFERNAIFNFDYARRHRTNPFLPRHYSFEVAAEIVTDLAQRYGQWQNKECHDMKAHLVELDEQRSGRVSLGLLYAQPHSASYHFSESADYLRKIGALDETGSAPKVLITNYITGPSNCIAASSYYSVCCLSSCDSIMAEIEHGVLAPKASIEQLLNIVRNISNVKVLPKGLTEKLAGIAAHHDGEVPIHGRLFAQWLHFAFPHECAYPAILENAKTLATSEWHSVSFSASDEERVEHLLTAQVLTEAADDSGLAELWSHHEVLPCSDLVNDGMSIASAIRIIIQIVAVLVGLHSIVAAWKSAVGSGGKKKERTLKKDDNLAHDFCV